MNRRILLTGAAVLPLGACGTTGGGLPPNWQATLDEVLQKVAIGCGYLPTVASVLALIGLGPVPLIVSWICDAINPPGITKATPHYPGQTAAITVKGVTVSGVYLR